MTKKFLTPAGQSPSQLNLGAIIVAGGTAGVAMWAIAIPPDVRSQASQITLIPRNFLLAADQSFPFFPLHPPFHLVICHDHPIVLMQSSFFINQVLKSRLQSAPTGTYSGILDCARKTIAADGIGALWKGFGPAMARAFPANAATFVCLIFFSVAIFVIPEVLHLTHVLFLQLGVEASRKFLDKMF